jgi:homogentisate 1,2-dioxygenase
MYYQRHGHLPRKPFTRHTTEAGADLHEEMLTSSGFSGPSSLVYRLRPATAINEIKAYPVARVEGWPDGSLTNHRLDLASLEGQGDIVDGRTTLFYNDKFAYSLCRVAGPEPLFYRNAWADELLLVVSGSGTLNSSFGTLRYGPLDLLYVPRGTVTRLEDLDGPQSFAVVESRSPISPPAHQRGSSGQLSYLGMYQESDIRSPDFQGPVSDDSEYQIVVKQGDRHALHTVPAHPFDAVGWSGSLYPFALNMDDLNPMSSRLHSTPDLWQIFESKAFAVTAMTPLRLPDHPDSTSAQPDHSADCDEIFHRLGRRGANGRADGSVTLHTRANPHGASMSLKARAARDRTSGYGLILDVFDPVLVSTAAAAVDDPDYYRSWA